MAVTITSRKWRGPRALEITYQSDLTTDAPVFHIYRGGTLIQRTRSTTAIILIPRGEAPTIEISDAGPIAKPVGTAGRAELAWYAIPGAVRYRIEEYVNSAWVTRAELSDANNAAGYFTWTSRFLEDSVEHQFRIIPIDAGGNEGAARTHTLLMVRHPDPPVVSITYNGSATPTITLADAS